jgi:hypothetical protein
VTSVDRLYFCSDFNGKIDFYVSCVLSSSPLLISIFGWSFNLAVRSSTQSPPPKTFPSRLRAPVRSVQFPGLLVFFLGLISFSSVPPLLAC